MFGENQIKILDDAYVSGGNEEDVLIFRNKKMKLMANSSLLIRNTSKDDVGLYRCRVKNGIGSGLVHTIKLAIGGNVLNGITVVLYHTPI